MCVSHEAEAPLCGLVNRVRSWFSGPEQPEPEPDGPALSYDPADLGRGSEIAHHRHIVRALLAGQALCSQCHGVLGSDGDSDLFEGRCWGCSVRWLEDQVIHPLLSRLGRRGTRRALIKLVSEVRRLV